MRGKCVPGWGNGLSQWECVGVWVSWSSLCFGKIPLTTDSLSDGVFLPGGACRPAGRLYSSSDWRWWVLIKGKGNGRLVRSLGEEIDKPHCWAGWETRGREAAHCPRLLSVLHPTLSFPHEYLISLLPLTSLSCINRHDSRWIVGVGVSYFMCWCLYMWSCNSFLMLSELRVLTLTCSSLLCTPPSLYSWDLAAGIVTSR